MSNTTPTPSRGTEASDGSHFTIEDAGSTTDAADLFDNDTTASGAAAAQDEDPIASADAVATAGAASGPGSQADGSATSAGSSSGGTAVAATAVDSPSTSADAAEPQRGRSALVDDASIAHVFDQTNGVVEGLDGDSDGSAASDELSSGERADGNPAFERFADTTVEGARRTDDTRTTGS